MSTALPSNTLYEAMHTQGEALFEDTLIEILIVQTRG